VSRDARGTRRGARQIRLAVNLAVATSGLVGLAWLATSRAPRVSTVTTPVIARGGAVETPSRSPRVASARSETDLVEPDRTPTSDVRLSFAGQESRFTSTAIVGSRLAPSAVRVNAAPACEIGGQRQPLSPGRAPAYPSAVLEARALVRAVEWLPAGEALPRVLAALDACRDPAARALLIQAERRARLRASPLELASADAPDLAAVSAACAPGALPEQLALLDDPRRPFEVRAAAAAALRSVGDPSLSAALERTLRDGDAVGRRLAAEALAGRPLHPDSESALEHTLHDVDSAVRAASARALAAQGRGANAIARALTRETDLRSLVACVEALGLLGAVEHVPLLEPLAVAGASSVREATTRALARLRAAGDAR
jgi:hypothetical protein